MCFAPLQPPDLTQNPSTSPQALSVRQIERPFSSFPNFSPLSWVSNQPLSLFHCFLRRVSAQRPVSRGRNRHFPPVQRDGLAPILSPSHPHHHRSTRSNSARLTTGTSTMILLLFLDGCCCVDAEQVVPGRRATECLGSKRGLRHSPWPCLSGIERKQHRQALYFHFHFYLSLASYPLFFHFSRSP